MSSTSNIGRLQRTELRTIWRSEASNFTPWLLDNADVLCELLGLDFSIDAAEHPVGGFSLDLIGQVHETGDVIIIENQLEESDHRHLGQILTYAGGTDAKHIVWISPSFREEHRQALEWLNERTDEQTRFFAVKIEAVTIGDSLPAPLFSLVVKPNDWGKAVRRAAPRSSRTTWLREGVLETARQLHGDSVARNLEQFLDSHERLGAGAYLSYGQGAAPSVTLAISNGNSILRPWTLTVDNDLRLSVNFDWIHKSGQGLSAEYMESFAEQISFLPGSAVAAEDARVHQWHRRPGLLGLPIFTDSQKVDIISEVSRGLYAEFLEIG